MQGYGRVYDSNSQEVRLQGFIGLTVCILRGDLINSILRAPNEPSFQSNITYPSVVSGSLARPFYWERRLHYPSLRGAGLRCA